MEDTGEPVPGAWLRVTDERIKPETSSTTSGPDGRYRVNLAPGAWFGVAFKPPAGYWVADISSAFVANFVLSREAPVYQRDFVVRRGTIWEFQTNDDIGSSDGSHVSLGVTDALEPEFTTEPAETNSRRFGHYPSDPGEKGQVRLTLPSEGRRLKLMVTPRPSDKQGLASTRTVVGLLEWTTGFQPASLSRIEKTGQGYHLVDRAGRTADLRCGEEIELKESNGKPTIALRLRKADRPQSRDLTGRVVDREGNPIEGAKVTLVHYIESVRTNDGNSFTATLTGSIRSRDGVVTDRDGRFLITRIPFTDRDKEAKKISVSVKKQGYATAASPRFVFRPGANGGPHVVEEPVRLEPSVSLSGTAVDPSGKAVVGARVWGWYDPQGAHVEPTHTDDAGRFLLHGLTKGVVTLKCDYGELHATGTFTVDGKGEDIRLQLRPVTIPAAPSR